MTAFTYKCMKMWIQQSFNGIISKLHIIEEKKKCMHQMNEIIIIWSGENKNQSVSQKNALNSN